MSTSDTIRILGKDSLALTLPAGPIIEGVPFSIGVTAVNGHGDTDTDYDCELCLQITDQDGDALVYTVDEGGDTMTSGVATYSNVSVTVGDATAVNITVTTAETTATIKGAGFEAHDYCPEGVASRPVDTASLVFTAGPTSITRDTNFTLTVQVEDTEHNVLTSFAGPLTVTLIGGHESDVFASTSARTLTLTMANGVATSSTVQIAEGVGVAEGTIRVEFSGLESQSYGIGIGDSFASHSNASARGFYGTATVEPTAATNPDDVEWTWVDQPGTISRTGASYDPPRSPVYYGYTLYDHAAGLTSADFATGHWRLFYNGTLLGYPTTYGVYGDGGGGSYGDISSWNEVDGLFDHTGMTWQTGTNNLVSDTYFPDSNTEMAEASWSECLSDAFAAFDGDSIGTMTKVEASIYDKFTYIRDLAKLDGGYTSFSLSEADKQSAGFRLSMKAGVTNASELAAATAFVNANATLKIKLGTDSEQFTSGKGAALRASTPDVTITATELNALQAAAGGTYSSLASVTVDLPAAWFNALAGGTSTVYVWLWWEFEPDCSANGAVTATAGSVSNIKLEVLT